MPWVIKRTDKGQCVFKQRADGQATGDPLGCHPSEDEAKKQLAALYASESQAKAVKLADGFEDVVEGPGIPWGGYFNGRDLDGQFFSPKTDFAFEWFGEGARPALYHHGLDEDAGTTVVGRVKSWEVKADLGVWTRIQLDKQSKYFQAIKDLVAAGKLYFSSGAMAHLVQVDEKSGEIKRWPWVELSLTPTPANLLATVDFPTASKHFEAAGIKAAWPDEAKLPITINVTGDSANVNLDTASAISVATGTKATLDVAALDNLPASDFAYIDSSGGRHPPMADAAHARNALARFDQTIFESDEAKQKARRKLVARCKELGVEVSEDMMAVTGGMDGKAAKMGMPAMRQMMTEMATEMGMGMSPDEMTAMMASLDAGMPEAEMRTEMRKKMQAHKQRSVGGKSATIKSAAGSYEELLEDLTALVNPFSPFSSPVDSYARIEAAYSDHIIVCRRRAGEETTWRVAYTLDADGKPKLGDATEVEETYIPVGSGKAVLIGSLATQAEALTHYAATLTQSTKDLRERRIKEGRIISMANRKRLADCLISMRAAADDLQALLDSTEPQPAKAASVRRLRARLVAQQIEALALTPIMTGTAG